MISVSENQLLNIYYESFHIPIGLFSSQGQPEKLLPKGESVFKKFYMDNVADVMKHLSSIDQPLICYDGKGSCWGILPYDHKLILLGPVQTGRNISYSYGHMPELNWNNFQSIVISFSKLLLGENVEVTEQKLTLQKHSSMTDQTEKESDTTYELKNYNELFDCVSKGDLPNLKRILNSEELQIYLDHVITNRKIAERVFQFALTRAYHIVQDVCGTSDELSQLSRSYMNASISRRYDLAARSTFQRMLYDFTQYVWQYHNRNYSRLTNKVLYYINDHIYEQITMKEISSYCMTSISTLQHHIKTDTGKTISDLIREKKMEKACFFLKDTDLSCNDIALRLHYGSQSYFISQFRKEMEMTPLTYRNYCNTQGKEYKYGNQHSEKNPQ